MAWCKTPECPHEAISVVVFWEKDEAVRVCATCENAISMALNRIDGYDVSIIPIDDWYEEEEEDECSD